MVVVVPDLGQYIDMNEKTRLKTVSNLNLASIALLVKNYPHEEVREGFTKAKDLLGWIFENEYSKEIKRLVFFQIESFIKRDDAYKLLHSMGYKVLKVGGNKFYPAKNPL
jgi:hypothetical protein